MLCCCRCFKSDLWSLFRTFVCLYYNLNLKTFCSDSGFVPSLVHKHCKKWDNLEKFCFHSNSCRSASTYHVVKHVGVGGFGRWSSAHPHHQLAVLVCEPVDVYAILGEPKQRWWWKNTGIYVVLDETNELKSVNSR